MADGRRINLLGRVSLEVDRREQPIVEAHKALGLLGYLLRQAGPVPRSRLAALLWGETTDYRSRRNLTHALGLLGARLPGCFRADQRQVQWAPPAGLLVDVEQFAALSRQPDLAAMAAAAALYRGDFLAGLELADSPEFEAWLAREREQWRRRAGDLLAALSAGHLAGGAALEAERYARRRIDLEPWQEEGHQALMRALAAQGRRGDALVQLQLCRRILSVELGIEPSAEILALAEQIRSAGADPPGAEQPKDAPAPPPAEGRAPAPAALPPLPGALVGRAAELAYIGQALAPHACRLLTLVGPGGIGKTRLALEAAHQLAGPPGAPRFPGGVAFVPLADQEAPAGSAAAVVARSVGEALGLPPSDVPDPSRQVIAALQGRRALLVLDNFEQLVEAAPFLAELLEEAPQVALLVTSREPLRLRDEWLLDLSGLDYPTLIESAEPDPRFRPDLPPLADLEAYGAVQLFLRRARAMQPALPLDEANLGAILRICRLVEGMPIALEMAAAWTRTTPCAQIAAQIAAGLDALVASFRDTPPRHRSVRAVFDQSWARLDAGERQTLCAAAVFQGGFNLEAAAAVLGPAGTLDAQGAARRLDALVDRSLLRRDPQGRYSMHALIKQYAGEQLAGLPSTRKGVIGRHSRYYGAWVGARAPCLAGESPAATLAEIGAEIENLRGAWLAAVAAGDQLTLSLALDGLARFCELRSRFQEGEALLARADAALADQHDPAALTLRLGLRVWRGIFCERMGAYAEGAGLLEEGLALHAPDQRVRSLALSSLGKLMDRQGDYEAARALNLEAHALAEAAGDRAAAAAALHNLGSALEGLGAYEEARRATAEGLAIRQELGDSRGVAYSLNNLGVIYEMLGDLAEATALYHRSLAHFEVIDDCWGLFLPLGNLGDIYATQGAVEAAYGAYLRTLDIALSIWSVPQMLVALYRLADMLWRMGSAERAAELLALPLQYPATEQSFRQRAANLFAEIVAGIGPQAATQARARGAARSLNSLARELLAAGAGVASRVP